MGRYWHLFETLGLFFFSLLIFTVGLSSTEVIGIDSRFYLFALEMWRHGPTWFPMTYQHPYPDYPVTSTFLIYLLALLYGGVNKLIAVIPTASVAALTIVLTYLIGSLHSKRWGWSGAFFLLMTAIFVKSARGLSIDMYPTLITACCFYLIYSADLRHQPRRVWWIFPLFMLGFIFRGPIGFIIPAGVVCSYYLLDAKFKRLLLIASMALVLLIALVSLFVLLAKQVGGTALMHDVLRMEVLCRVKGNHYFDFYYFSNSIFNYALSFPLACLVIGGIFYYAIQKSHQVPAVPAEDRFLSAIPAKKRGNHFLFIPHRVKLAGNASFLLKLFAWIMVIMIGMSIPGDKKIRYILPIAPAIALLAAYPFVVPLKQTYFIKLRDAMLKLFLFLPAIFLLTLEVVYLYAKHVDVIIKVNYLLAAVLLVVMQCIMILYYYATNDRQEQRTLVILFFAMLSFVLTEITVIEPIEIFINRARDFVFAIETERLEQRAVLAFYKEHPDTLPIKYLINSQQEVQPLFINDIQALLQTQRAAFFVTSVDNFEALPDAIARQFKIVGSDMLGHIRVVVFTNKTRQNGVVAPMSNTKICLHCYISGKVQNVSYRASTREQAERLGICGWAKNLPDGRVEVMACGEPDKLAELREWLHRGAKLASVTDVLCEELPWQAFSHFKTRY